MCTGVLTAKVKNRLGHNVLYDDILLRVHKNDGEKAVDNWERSWTNQTRASTKGALHLAQAQSDIFP